MKGGILFDVMECVKCKTSRAANMTIIWSRARARVEKNQTKYICEISVALCKLRDIWETANNIVAPRMWHKQLSLSLLLSLSNRGGQASSETSERYVLPAIIKNQRSSQAANAFQQFLRPFHIHTHMHREREREGETERGKAATKQEDSFKNCNKTFATI